MPNKIFEELFRMPREAQTAMMIVGTAVLFALAFWYVSSRLQPSLPEPVSIFFNAPASQSLLQGNSAANPAAEGVVPLPPARGETKIMAWFYPGEPACGAKAEYSDGRKIDVLKPEYFMVGDGGTLLLLTEDEYGCNGYSKANVADIKQYSKEQYATVSSADSTNMALFLASANEEGGSIDTLVNFAVEEGITGIEIDFEDFGGWTPEAYAGYKAFLRALGEELHANGKKLMIDGPATSNEMEENWFLWRYADFVDLPVDTIVIMAYDYQYDYGSGEPIAPLSWVIDVIRFTAARFPDASRLAVGVPSYGYEGTHGTQEFSLLTKNELSLVPGIAAAKRDQTSGELTLETGGTVYYFQDATSLAKKVAAIRQAGISQVSVWHLGGGNAWIE